MELTPLQQQALARWHELGPTTPAHPILQMAYDLYFAPMGIVCDALVYDALAAVENRAKEISLVAARFDPQKVDRDWSQFKIVEPLLSLTELVAPVFAVNGVIEEFAILKDLPGTDENNSIMSTFVQGSEKARLEEFEKTKAQAIFDLSHQLAVAAKLYIDSSLDMMIQPETVSSEFAKAFVANPRQYAAVVFQMMTQGREPKA